MTLIERIQLRKSCFIAAVAVIVAAYAVKLPMERALNRDYAALGFGNVSSLLSVREKLSQYMFVALMGGFRNVVANLLWISAHNDWERHLWFKQKEKYHVVNTLQPNSIYFWDNAAWHFAWNSSYAASVDPLEPRESVRARNQQMWFDLGEETLKKGIEHNPGSWELHAAMARLLADKQKRPLEAAEYYRKAAAFPETPTYLKRQVAFKLLDGGDIQGAYDEMRRLWLDSEDNHVPTFRTRIPELEDQLQIPSEKRLFAR
ncbi:hypothetical protein QQ055_10455 [Geitlerinema calcuttense NRMC-F 0142]|uniref:Uncharacterized protein n=2 Tax=Geitlerinema TaxID=63132 RepID=A0ABT7M1D1_9CYAN|nr:hypothetical protein [Geitlerinema calcuttense NRMC-F 0142]